MTVYMELGLHCEIYTIAVLHFGSEQGSVNLQHAKPLTRQPKGNQIIQIGFVHSKPTKNIHNIIDEDGSMT